MIWENVLVLVEKRIEAYRHHGRCPFCALGNRLWDVLSRVIDGFATPFSNYDYDRILYVIVSPT
jgi:hypothetical protein